MKSMTGYGFSESNSLDDIEIRIEIRAVNRKQLDIKLNLPKELQKEEIEIRRIIASHISRGSVYVKIDTACSGLNKTVKINRVLAESYINKAAEIQKKLGLSGNLEIKDLFLLPDVIEIAEVDIAVEGFVKQLFLVLEKTLLELDASREEEGLFLKKDISSRISLMEKLIVEIEPLAEKLPGYYKAKLQKRLEEECVPHIDDDRLLREVVLYTDKCDVSEEITRLKSHIIQFKNMLRLKNQPVGRKLDFLTQEIQREINTLGVKAASSDISPKVVQFKTEAERIREQVQNVE